MDVWSVGDEVAFAEMRTVIEPLLFRYFVDETHDVERSRDLLDQTLLRVEFGAYQHETDVVGWAFEIASRLATAASHEPAPAPEAR